MQPHNQSALESRLAEVLMSALFPCDLGDGIEVVHDVEVIEIEMDCDLEHDPEYSAPYEKIEILLEASATIPILEEWREAPIVNVFERSPVCDTLPFAPFEPTALGTETVPYPRIDPETLPFVRPR